MLECFHVSRTCVCDFWHESVLEIRNSDFVSDFQNLGRSADRSSAIPLPGSVSRPIQMDTVATVSPRIGQPTDPSANREFGTKSAVTNRSANRSVSHWSGSPTDQWAAGSVGRPIQPVFAWVSEDCSTDRSKAPVSSPQHSYEYLEGSWIWNLTPTELTEATTIV